MAGDQAGGAAERVDAFHARDDGDAGVGFVAGLDFFARELRGDGHLAVEVVGVRGAEAGDLAIGLRPGGGVARVGVYDAADFGEGTIEGDVGGEIG